MSYPESIAAKLSCLTHCRELEKATAEGVGVNLACGSTVRFFLRIDEGGQITNVAFRSNGCGYSRAAADVLAELVTNEHLVDLHGLNVARMKDAILSELGEIPDENIACANAATYALKDAFANYHTLRREEFRGENVLICTCFGVTEERIEDIITNSQLTSVEQVTDLCNAGGGCGSCRMLIQELLDSVL